MSDEERRKWLAGLNVGDEVAVSRGYGGLSFEKVTKVTPQKIDVGNVRYRRTDGHKEGDSTVYWSVLHIPTAEMKKKHRETRMRERLRKILYELSPSTLPIATVRKLLAILEDKDPPHES